MPEIECDDGGISDIGEVLVLIQPSMKVFLGTVMSNEFQSCGEIAYDAMEAAS